MNVNNGKEHGCAIHVDITQKPSSVHVAHNMLHAVKGKVDVGNVVHRQENARGNHNYENDPRKGAKIPHVRKILRGWVIPQFVVNQVEKGKAVVNPF